MNSFTKSIFSLPKKIFEKYPIVLAAIVIYLYYLLTSYDFFSNYKEKQSFLDYVLQFDSLIFLWLAIAAYFQLRKLKQDRLNEAIRRMEVEKSLEIQKIHAKVINEITELLQDSVNNPLAVISLGTKEIRKKFEADPEIIAWLDRIEAAMKRIHNTIRDIQLYETQKLLEETNPHFQKSNK